MQTIFDLILPFIFFNLLFSNQIVLKKKKQNKNINNFFKDFKLFFLYGITKI